MAVEVRKLAEGSVQDATEIGQIVERIQLGAQGAVSEAKKAELLSEDQ